MVSTENSSIGTTNWHWYFAHVTIIKQRSLDVQSACIQTEQITLQANCKLQVLG